MRYYRCLSRDRPDLADGTVQPNGSLTTRIFPLLQLSQGEFTTGDYEEIMNKASCLSLVSHAILYWNTIKISAIITDLKNQGEVIENETLSHISLLPFKHVVPNGTYFIDDL